MISLLRGNPFYPQFPLGIFHLRDHRDAVAQAAAAEDEAQRGVEHQLSWRGT